MRRPSDPRKTRPTSGAGGSGPKTRRSPAASTAKRGEDGPAARETTGARARTRGSAPPASPHKTGAGKAGAGKAGAGKAGAGKAGAGKAGAGKLGASKAGASKKTGAGKAGAGKASKFGASKAGGKQSAGRTARSNPGVTARRTRVDHEAGPGDRRGPAGEGGDVGRARGRAAGGDARVTARGGKAGPRDMPVAPRRPGAKVGARGTGTRPGPRAKADASEPRPVRGAGGEAPPRRDTALSRLLASDGPGDPEIKVRPGSAVERLLAGGLPGERPARARAGKDEAKPRAARDEAKPRAARDEAKPRAGKAEAKPRGARDEAKGEPGKPGVARSVRGWSEAPTGKPARRGPARANPSKGPERLAPAKVRLQKVLAAAGVAARRKAEDLIARGRVTVNGRVASELGVKVDPERDQIRVDGKVVQVETRVYFVLNKPDGVVCSAEGAQDAEGRPTVLSLLPTVSQRVYPVGRLDYHTRGVLILTNDGDLAAALTHPRHKVAKTYHVKFQGRLGEAELAALGQGITLEDGTVTRPAEEVSVIKETETNTWVQITLRQGLNRQVRRMGDAIGHPVLKLIRVAVGSVTADGLEDGEFRPLTPTEVYDLMAAASR